MTALRVQIDPLKFDEHLERIFDDRTGVRRGSVQVAVHLGIGFISILALRAILLKTKECGEQAPPDDAGTRTRLLGKTERSLPVGDR